MTTEKPSLKEYFTAWAIDTATAPIRMYGVIYSETREDFGPIAGVPAAAAFGTMGNGLAVACGLLGYVGGIVVGTIVGMDADTAGKFGLAAWGGFSSQVAHGLTLQNSRTEVLMKRERDCSIAPV